MKAQGKSVEEVREQLTICGILDRWPNRLIELDSGFAALPSVDYHRSFLQVDRPFGQRAINERLLLLLRVQQHIIADLPQHQIDIYAWGSEVLEQRGRVRTVAAV